MRKEAFSLLLYGASGTGKTRFWATFPGPILAVICSGSRKKKGELRSLNEEQLDKTEALNLEHSLELKEIIGHQAGGGKYKTVVLDHVTGLQDLTLKEILNLDEVPLQKSWGLAAREDYGTSTTQCKEMLQALLGLDCNVVIIGHERLDKNDDDPRYNSILHPVIGVATTPALATWIHGAADYVGQTFIRPKTEVILKPSKRPGKPPRRTVRRIPDEIEYCLRCQPDDVRKAKFRVPDDVTPLSVMVDPTYDKVMAMINGEQFE